MATTAVRASRVRSIGLLLTLVGRARSTPEDGARPVRVRHWRPPAGALVQRNPELKRKKPQP